MLKAASAYGFLTFTAAGSFSHRRRIAARMSTLQSSVAKRPFSITGMDLSGYMVKDGARSIAWYRDVLGLEPVLLYPDNRGAEYELSDGSTFGLFGGGGTVMPFQPGNGILFAVDDLAAAVAALKARGLPVMERETPNCKMAVLNDPDGNSIFLHKRK